ncbi:BA75_03424T0 [Komagataella pastoris]|uniref:BA75_03424T0 n=1 Tax=Komagataella pastoris TaxID=4922 RepID=A0A1B2JFU2_PICPA|nr:BA75_03424T0 [Komagataella pastoris]
MIGSLGYEYLLEQPDCHTESISFTENLGVSSKPKLVLASPSLKCLYSSKRSTSSSLRHYNCCLRSSSIEDDDSSSLMSSDEDQDLDFRSVDADTTVPIVHSDYSPYLSARQPSYCHSQQLQKKHSYVSFTLECNQDHPLAQPHVSEKINSMDIPKSRTPPYTEHRNPKLSSLKQILTALAEGIGNCRIKVRRMSQQRCIVHQNTSISESLPPVPLRTFHTSITVLESNNNINFAPPHSITSRLQHKVREPRVNSNFLRFYAQDYSIKEKHLLPISEDDIDDYQYKLDLGEPIPDSSFSSYCKLGLLSRERLWSSVILPPRSDEADDHSLFNNEYKQLEVYPHSKNSICRSRDGMLPWIKFCDKNRNKLLEPGQLLRQKSLKPYGILNQDTQYVVKGWINKRFIPITSSD